MKKYIYIIIIFLFRISNIYPQNIASNLRSSIELGTYFSPSGRNPFWLRSNQYGIIPLESQFITLRGSSHKEYDSTKTKNNKISKFGYGYGASTAINVGKVNQIYLPEAYFKIRYGTFEFYGGRRKEIVGLVDTTLTSGSYIWSGNALPLPKIQISIPNYTSIIGKGLVSIKGSYAHGWFGSQGSTKNFFLHQKTLYGRIGKPNWKVKFYGGFNHQVQWGGKPQIPFIETQTGKLISNYPTGLATYLKVISGISLNTIENTPDIPINEAWNRAGNHLGSVDIATEFNVANFAFLVYRQNIYEDGSLFYLNNIADGLFGLSVYSKQTKNKSFKLLFEYLNTQNQGGSEGGGEQTISELRGRDNYFNNSIYFDGWAYNNYVIGTPMMRSLSQIKPNLIDTENAVIVPNTFIANNRLQAFNLSLTRITTRNNFSFKWVHTLNYGSFATPLISRVSQNSFMVSVSKKNNNFTYNANITGDFGGLVNNSVGFYINVVRNW